MIKRRKHHNKCPICGRPTHRKSKYCIFHASAEEKTEEDFKRKLKKYVAKIKEKDNKYDFDRFIFIGDINFNEDLNITIFENANFRKTTFNGCANFKGATFEAGAYFTGATFNGPAFFSRATFKTGSTFTGTTFKENAYFTFATFNGYAIFDKANFKGDVSFYLKNLLTYLSLNEAKVFPGKKLSIDVNNGKNNIYFKRAYLENACLNLELCEDVFIDLTDTLLRNTKIKKDQIKNHIFQEKEKNFSEAQEIYLFLKNNFHSIGRYDDESWAFQKEKEMERSSYSFGSFTKIKENKEKKSKFALFFNWLQNKKFRKWLNLCFFNAIYGYGEKPQNVIFSAIFIIILFSVFFSFLGINSPEIIEMKSPTVQEIFNSNSEIISKGNLINKTTNYYIDCLYFSAITFTTLGYGDFRPLEGCGRIFAGSEAFIGAIMMALFVYTFARRTGGR